MSEAQFAAGIVGAFLAIGLMCGVALIVADLRKRIRLSLRVWRDIRIPKMERRYINFRKRIERRRRVAAKPSRNSAHVEHDPEYVPEWLRDQELPNLLRRHAT